METLAERQIGIETSLTSNVQTSTVPDYASHPARRFLERGMVVTLNTDDPGISDIDLHVETLEHCRYTTILRMTYLFGDAEGPVAEPDLEVRVYHDARLAEATHGIAHPRHPGLAGLRAAMPAGLGERWLRNMLLNKWLDYCAERGHRFAPAGVPGAA